MNSMPLGQCTHSCVSWLSTITSGLCFYVSNSTISDWVSYGIQYAKMKYEKVLDVRPPTIDTVWPIRNAIRNRAIASTKQCLEALDAFNTFFIGISEHISSGFSKRETWKPTRLPFIFGFFVQNCGSLACRRITTVSSGFTGWFSLMITILVGYPSFKMVPEFEVPLRDKFEELFLWTLAVNPVI